MTRYDGAKEIYARLGVDTEKALDALKDVTVSVHCWQGDDVIGLMQRSRFRAEFRQREIT